VRGLPSQDTREARCMLPIGVRRTTLERRESASALVIRA
jgi:hypothetical protein